MTTHRRRPAALIPPLAAALLLLAAAPTRSPSSTSGRADGNVQPLRTIETVLPWDPQTIDFDLDLVHDGLVIADRTPGAVGLRFFRLAAAGVAAPLRSIAGPATGITANGDAAPLRTIASAATHLNGPSRLSYFPALIFADGFEGGDTAAWDLVQR
jgi:hypothetical protein